MEVSWDAPSQDSRGNVLLNLVGYRVYHGSQPGEYTSVTDVRETVATLMAPPGTRYVAVTAYGVNQIESAFSDELVLVVTAAGEVEVP